MPGKSNLIIIGVIFVVLVVIASALNTRDDAQPVTWADPDNIALVKQGEPIYAEICASCHGENLEGQPNWRTKNEDGRMPAPPHDASGHSWHHPDQVLFAITKDGGQKNAPDGFISGMPGFGDILSDHEIWASLAYIKSRWPDEIRKRHAQMSERMKAN